MVLRIIQILLAAYATFFAVLVGKDAKKHPDEEKLTGGDKALFGLTGLVTCFFDALGIGNYATTMTIFKWAKRVDDSKLVGTLNNGYLIPVYVEAFLYVTAIKVDTLTLVSSILACFVGAFFGSRVAAKLNVRSFRMVISIALFIAASFMTLSALGLTPLGGEAIGLRGVKLVILLVATAFFGFLIPLGIGNFAPHMCVVYLLGMSPAVSFPIMMCSATAGMAMAGPSYVKAGKYIRKAVPWMAILGSIGVLVAVFVVKNLPLEILTWIVIAVVFYTSISTMVQVIKTGRTKENA